MDLRVKLHDLNIGSCMLVLYLVCRVQPELWGEGSGLVHETRPSHATLKKKKGHGTSLATCMHAPLPLEHKFTLEG